MTQQRRLILEILRRSYSHPTAADIYAEARQSMPTISLGTVYRNLSVLTDGGDIVRISLPGLPDRYDLPKSVHWHVVCDVCGSVRDIPAERDLITRIEQDSGEKLVSYLLTAHCVCRDCLAAENKRDK